MNNFLEPTFYFLQANFLSSSEQQKIRYQSSKGPGPLLEQETNPAVSASSKKTQEIVSCCLKLLRELQITIIHSWQMPLQELPIMKSTLKTYLCP